VRKIADLGSGFGEELEVSGSSFFDARFGAARAFGKQIA